MANTDAQSDDSFELFPDDLSACDIERILLKPQKPLTTPVWTQHKARLIELYLYFFVQITKHGAYIDGFAGPQYAEYPDAWSARRVMESVPRRLQKFFLCELDPEKVRALESMRAAQSPPAPKEPKRKCEILHGDFNKLVDGILTTGGIRPKEATFALLDQRTFECHWATLKKLAAYKPEGQNKIELFYFWGVKWLHRSLSGVSANETRIDDWWGNSGWRELQSMSQHETVKLVVDRFKNELGYRFALPFPIYGREEGQGSIMYQMIHATDHPEAPKLMYRAYRQAVTRSGPPPEQGSLAL